MASSSAALQAAIYTRLAGDAALSIILGGARVYDHVPRNAAYPYVAFAGSVERDWSTGSEEGHEHLVTIHAWTRGGGHREADEVLAAVRTALHDHPLALDGWRLVNLRHEFSEVRRDRGGEVFHGLTRFRAVTEPA
jgi:hypothetical protein